ncbi:MAG: hypothetical protein Q9169_005555 [Polycauliona sp. 2 TL-2023]
MPGTVSCGPPPTLTHACQVPVSGLVTQVRVPNQQMSPKAHLLSLPVAVLKRILSQLLISPSRLLLQRDASTPSTYHTSLATNILFVNHQLYHSSLPILYGSNTFTTSSPATSYDFDVHLTRVPGKIRCLIRQIDLQINWGRQLWMKFPLIAMRLGELRGLTSLRLQFVETEDSDKGILVQGGPKGATTKREGHIAVVMLKAEKKMLKEMVRGMRALKVFELTGFEDADFARRLEVCVKNGWKS